MNVRQRRKGSRVDLDDRTKHDELPVGPSGGHTFEERQIHALVNHTEEADARVRNCQLIGRIRLSFARSREVFDIYAAWKRVGVVMPLAFRFVEALSSRK